MKKIFGLIFLGLVTLASANSFEVTPTFGGIAPENSDFKNKATYGARIGYNVDYIINQVELGYDRAENFYKEKDSNILYLNVTKDIYNFTDNFKIYGLTGVGLIDFKGTDTQIKDSGFWQYGLGLKYNITENFNIKTEARDMLAFDYGDHFFAYSLGFGLEF